MFTSFIHTITGTKFQINQLTITLFSAPQLVKSQNAVCYRVKTNKLKKIVINVSV